MKKKLCLSETPQVSEIIQLNKNIFVRVHTYIFERTKRLTRPIPISLVRLVC